jgi:hypothetical protein
MSAATACQGPAERGRRYRWSHRDPGERVFDLARRLPALLGVFFEAGSNDGREAERQRRLHIVEWRRLFLENGRHKSGLRVPDERSPAGEQLVQHDTEREQIAARVRILPFYLLRRHISQRAHHGTGGGGAGEGTCERRILRTSAGGAFDLRDAEVEHLHAIAREQDIFGLQVAVDDAAPVGSAERVQDLLRDLERSSGRQRSTQPVALHVLHYEVVRAHVVERADVRVIQRRDGASLALEPVAEASIAGLDGHQAVEASVSCFPHFAHAAGPDQGQNLVRSELRSGLKLHRLRSVCERRRPRWSATRTKTAS